MGFARVRAGSGENGSGVGKERHEGRAEGGGSQHPAAQGRVTSRRWIGNRGFSDWGSHGYAGLGGERNESAVHHWRQCTREGGEADGGDKLKDDGCQGGGVGVERAADREGCCRGESARYLATTLSIAGAETESRASRAPPTKPLKPWLHLLRG